MPLSEPINVFIFKKIHLKFRLQNAGHLSLPEMCQSDTTTSAYHSVYLFAISYFQWLIDTRQVVEILPQTRQEPNYST